MTACPGCDLLQRVPALPSGGRARCVRCGDTLAIEPGEGSLQRSLALATAAAIVFIIGNTTSLMGLSAVGRQASTTILGGAYEMWVQGLDLTAMVVAFCVVIAPAGYLAFMLTVLLAARRPPAPPCGYARIRPMETRTKSAGSELLSMMALVAAVVAAVILVFFGLGYLFGSLFL